MNPWWRTANAVMLLAFAASVAVQFNDPDPWRWALIYGAAAFACALALRGRSGPLLPASVAAAALLWVAWLAPSAIGRVGFGELFEAFEMKDARVEVGREFGGLLIILVWMTALLIAWRRTQRPGVRS